MEVNGLSWQRGITHISKEPTEEDGALALRLAAPFVAPRGWKNALMCVYYLEAH